MQSNHIDGRNASSGPDDSFGPDAYSGRNISYDPDASFDKEVDRVDGRSEARSELPAVTLWVSLGKEQRLERG